MEKRDSQQARARFMLTDVGGLFFFYSVGRPPKRASGSGLCRLRVVSSARGKVSGGWRGQRKGMTG